MIYLNDILVYSAIKKQHIKNVHIVFLQLQEYCLYINLKKCSFFISEVEFLEFIMRIMRVKINPSWIKSVMIWPQPASYKNMQIFLSFTNFYHWFISHYFKITALLTGLLKGSVKGKKTGLFEFSLIIKEIFDKLQKAFCSALMLKHFNSVLSIQLEINTSDFTLADIFSQSFKNTGENDINWHFVIFWL